MNNGFVANDSHVPINLRSLHNNCCHSTKLTEEGPNNSAKGL